MKIKYRAIYKCRMCGKLFDFYQEESGVENGDLPVILKNESVKYTTAIHTCKSKTGKCVGVGDICGFIDFIAEKEVDE